LETKRYNSPPSFLLTCVIPYHIHLPFASSLALSDIGHYYSGSAASDMAMVALGRVDLYIERVSCLLLHLHHSRLCITKKKHTIPFNQGIHIWDIAAGTVIVEEAGYFSYFDFFGVH
jgi:3'-phosphoadenosine 5'-phosphosulfate (PAPS) 3'-phosphatase